jgi:DNA-binding SARP family transcriptional activator
MSPAYVDEVAGKSIEQQIKGKALVMLAPRLRNRSSMLAYFMADGQDTYYYSLNPDDNNLSLMMRSLVERFADFDPKFGRQVESLPETASPEDIAEALAADLGKAKPKPRFVVIDNHDFLTHHKDNPRFFHRLVMSLPKGMQLVINSRTLEYTTWSSLVREGYAVVLGDTDTLDGGIFDPNKPDAPHLEVYGLGGGNVYVNGLPLTTWDGPLPRNLFYYFVDHPMVIRDEIFETFWPDLPTKEATNVFHVTKRKISERLGFELTAYSGGFYRPSGQMSVHYDVAAFEKSIEDAKLNPPTDPKVWYDAIRQYRTPFLHKIEMSWVIKRREQLRLTYSEALIGIARLYRGMDEGEQAVSFFLRALREVPEREDIHRDLMSLYKEQGNVQMAVKQYQTLEQTLKNTLGIAPSKATQSLYRTIVGSH